MAIELKFLLNPRQFLRGAKDVEGALDDVSDSLDDVAREGDQSSDKLAQSFRDLVRKAERAGDDIGDGLSAGVKRGTARASGGVADFKSEAIQTGRESAASFSGSWTDAGDIVQEVLANAFFGFGPAGVAAGLAAAAGVGIVISAIQKGTENAEEFKQQVGELAQELIDAGGVGTRSLDGMADTAKDLATQTDDTKTNLKDLEGVARTLGTTFGKVTAAYLGGGPALDELIRKNKELQQVEVDAAQQAGLSDSIYKQVGDTSLGVLAEQNRLLTQQRDLIKKAQDAELLYLQSGADLFTVKVGLIDAVNTAYDEAAGATSGFISAESGLFDVAGYITAMTARETALRNYQTTLASSGLSPEAIQFLNSQGQVAAATMLAGYTSAAPAQQAELSRIWKEAGREASGVASSELDRIGQQPVEATVTADTKPAESQLQSFLTKTRAIKVPLILTDSRTGKAVP